MTTKGSQFQPVPMIPMDDDDIDGEQSDEEHKEHNFQPNSHLAQLEAMQEEYTQRLSMAEPKHQSNQNQQIDTPVESNSDFYIVTLSTYHQLTCFGYILIKKNIHSIY